MTHRGRRLPYSLLVCLLALAIATGGCTDGVAEPSGAAEVDRPPHVTPDYGGVTVPVNMAPLSFCIDEPGERYHVRIAGDKGEAIVLGGSGPEVVIPTSAWRSLLEANRGNRLTVRASAQGEDGRWRTFQPLTIAVADEEIDRYVVYRLIRPIFNSWGPIDICQRDLSGYDETLVVRNVSFGEGCVNCHTFKDNDPTTMMLHTRGGTAGSATILVRDGVGLRVNTKSQYGLTGYTSWHPDGKMAVCAVVQVRQFFHSLREETRDVIDLDSTLVYYLVDEDRVGSHPSLADKDRMETYPCWHPDGKYLYFSSARKLWSDTKSLPPERYNEVRYDLMRVSYDDATGQWGPPEMVLSSGETHTSITQPRISPNGRLLVFCMADYGCFPVFQKSSDLYVMDLETRQYRKLQINSDETDSWHSWSSNGRWLMFASKRGNGLMARLYVSHVDREGHFSKPLLLPQKDPRFYESFIKTYNVPELAICPVPVRGREMARLIRTPMADESRMPMTSASPQVKAEQAEGDAYQQGTTGPR
ncbi:MAG: PD40 domain-containing protein [Planctomycetes bacterium]|nr:PD40 domain-containing protein [Planctomycetota bacterium]